MWGCLVLGKPVYSVTLFILRVGGRLVAGIDHTLFHHYLYFIIVTGSLFEGAGH